MIATSQKEDLKNSKVYDFATGQQAQIEQNQPNFKADSLDTQSVDALPNINLNNPENTLLESHKNLKMSMKGDVHGHNVYLHPICWFSD